VLCVRFILLINTGGQNRFNFIIFIVFFFINFWSYKNYFKTSGRWCFYANVSVCVLCWKN